MWWIFHVVVHEKKLEKMNVDMMQVQEKIVENNVHTVKLMWSFDLDGQLIMVK
jgi:hypothetical protein